MEAVIATPGLKKDWSPTADAFRRLLSWLDEGADSNGERYLEMRRRLERYFERRGCRAPEDLADETLNRVARRIDEEGTIQAACPAQYCYIVAKLVLYENVRRTNALTELKDNAEDVPRDGDDGEREQLLFCLERCLRQLPEEDRELIVEYYRGEKREKIEQRRALAARLGVSLNALSIRACRLRDKLEACVRTSLGEA